MTDGNGAEDARECPSSLWAEGSHQERKAPGMLICLFSVPSPSYMLPRQCNIYSTQQFAAVSRCVDRQIGGGKPGCGDLHLRCPTSVTAAGAPIHDSDGQNHALCHSLVPDCTEAAGCCVQRPAFYQVRRRVRHRTAQVLRIRVRSSRGPPRGTGLNSTAANRRPDHTAPRSGLGCRTVGRELRRWECGRGGARRSLHPR